MFLLTSGGLRKLVFTALALAGSAWLAPVLALQRSDILLDIVSHCVNPAQGDYCNVCRVPRNDAACGPAADCQHSTEVWALSERFTAIRDVKMCGCPADFVHGLALPTYPVRGVEDPQRPEEIWQFAWDAAVRRLEPESIARVVNPQLRRSQNQLHVHLLRLQADARPRLLLEAPSHADSLAHIWATAAAAAAAKGLQDYGVLVSQHPQGGFDVVVTASSPEGAFTKWRCDE